MKNSIRFAVAALAIGGTIAATTVFALRDQPLYVNPSYANNISQVIDCGNGYKTDLDWNIAPDEALNTGSVLIDTVTVDIPEGGYYSWSSRQFGKKAVPNATVTYTLKTAIDGLGFYSRGTNASNGTNLTINDVEYNQGLTSESTRWFVDFDTPISEFSISGTVFYLDSIGFYFHEIPTIEPEQSDSSSEDVTTEQTTIESEHSTSEASQGNVITFNQQELAVNSQTISKDNITLNNSSSYTGSVTELRIYKGQTLTVSSNVNISSIQFVCSASGTAKYGPGCFAAQNGYSYNDINGTWVGNAKSITFTASSNQVRITELTVTI